MIRQMLSKARHLLTRSSGRHRLAGGGLFDRMRATTFALLGGTAAFCLVLVALLSQQGVPYLPALPIPGAGGGDEAISNGSAVARGGNSATVRIPTPAGVPAGPDRIPTLTNAGAGSPDSNSDPAGPRQVASNPPGSGSPADNGSGGGQQPGTPSPTSQPQSSPVANPAPGGSNASPGSQPGSGGNAEADAVNAAGGGGAAKPSKPGFTPPPTTATTAAQQAAAPPASAPPAPAPGSPSAAEEAAAEDAAASP
jgi:hypothetical protein